MAEVPDNTGNVIEIPEETEFIVNEAVPAFYANYCNVGVTAEEGILRFGVRSPNDPRKVVPVATLFTSLAHLKRLATAMILVIESHEKRFGTIITNPVERLTDDARKELGIEDQNDAEH